MKVIKNVWKIICYPLMYIGIQTVVVFLYLFVLGFGMAMQLAIENIASGEVLQVENIDIEGMSEQLLSQFDIKVPLVISIFITLFVLFLIMKTEWAENKFWSFNKIKFYPVFLCVVLGIFFNFFTVGAMNLMPLREQEQNLYNMLGTNLTFEIISIAMLTPILEELIFRGIVQKRLTLKMRISSALILQALIFSFFHFNLLQGVYIFVLGIIIGMIYIWFDSIWYSVLIHGVYNATSVVIFHTVAEREISVSYLMILAGVSLVISIFSLVLLFDKRNKSEPIEPNEMDKG